MKIKYHFATSQNYLIQLLEPISKIEHNLSCIWLEVKRAIYGANGTYCIGTFDDTLNLYISYKLAIGMVLKDQITNRYLPLFVMAALGTVMVSKLRAKVAYAPGRYTELKKIPENERGKNPAVTIMYSMSRRNEQVKKLWVQKPFFDDGDGNKYDICAATKEVFFGEIAAAVFGKERAAKTTFSPERRGVISRIVGDNCSNVMDLQTFCNTDEKLPPAAQQTLMATIIFGLIVGDRDINLENIIFRSSAVAEQNIVYGIDREFAASPETADKISLLEALIRLSENPQEITNLLLDKRYHWNFFSRTENFNDYEIKEFAQHLTSDLNSEEFKKVLLYIINSLANDDFKVCHDAKHKIYKALYQSRGLYSVDEIETIIVPNMDISIAAVKNNVTRVKRFIDDKSDLKTTRYLLQFS
jgi:hypothetical protein